MEYFHQFNNFMNLLVLVLVIIVTLLVSSGGLEARSLSMTDMEVVGLKTDHENWYEMSLRELTAMLPKGPVPPSGPSPSIN